MEYILVANILKVKRSSVQGKVPLTTDLDLGELAVNTYDGKLFLKKNVGGTETIVDVTVGADAATILTLLKTVDGSGSGLDADLVEGMHAVSTNTVNSIVARDASGNFSAGTITAALSGNASTVTNGIYTTGSYADPAWITSINYSKLTGTIPTWNQNTTGSAAKWTTARTLSFTGDATGSGSVDGSANVATALTLANSGVTAGTYTKITVDAKGRATSGTTLAASDIPNLDASKITTGVLDAARLPSYVDDVLEYVNLAGFPVTGETGKIYVALDTNKTYRWSGSAYVYITSGAVDSVAGKTGVVTLVKSDVGLGNVDNTADANKNVLSATKLTTARTISLTGDVTGSVSFDGSGNAAITTTIAADSVALGTDTTGNYVASVATTAPLAGGAIGSEGGALTLSLASGYGDTQNPYGSKTANYFLAAPNGTAGAPTFRAIVAADIPTLNQNTTGSAATLTTVRTLTIGSTGKTFNGSADVSWSLAEIGAYAATNPNGYTTNTGTVTSVSGTGTASGLTLSGTVTSSGSLTLSGTVNALAAGTYGISISGNAATATNASYSYHYTQGFNSNWNTDFQDAPAGSTILRGDTSSGSSTGGPGGTWWFQQNMRHTNSSNYWGVQVAWGWEDNANILRTRNVQGGSYGSWVTYLNSANYSSYAIGRGGDTVSGVIQYNANQNTTGSNPPLQAYGTSGGAIMAFHRGGYYAVNMGLDSDNVFRIGGWSAAANRLQMDMSGNLTMAGNVTANSDERLKKNWRPVADRYVERLAAIKSGVYDRVDEEMTQAGVSAQSMQALLPEVVGVSADGTLSVAYGNAALVSAVELAKEVMSLKAEVTELKNLVANLLNTSKEQ